MRSFALAALMTLFAGPATAGPVIDCPLAGQPYSLRSPMLDVLLDPAAKAVLDREAPGLVSGFTRNFGGGDLPPGFAAIITPEFLIRARPDAAALGPRLDAALGRIAITPAARRARCARYDNVRPKMPERVKRPAMLVFEKITGFRDAPSVDAARAALKAMAQRRGWTLVFSEHGGVFNRRDLARFDAVIWNNVSGDALTLPQRRAFQDYLARGGGFAGVHGSGGDPAYFWDWYADTLLGARFIGHPMTPQFQPGRVVVEDRANGITRGLPAEWTMTEEWYSFATSPRRTGARVLATLDERSYSPVGFAGQSIAMGDHPIAWARCIGNGRSFYSAIGHRPESYAEPNSVKLLEQGVEWAAGLGQSRCVNGREQ